MDTVYDKELPSVEMDIATYHNFWGATTIGYNIILRGGELEIRDVILFKKDSTKIQKQYHTLTPFSAHFGDSRSQRRIDFINVKNKFPFTGLFSVDDSLLVVTNRGNYTVYLSEEKRSYAKYGPVIRDARSKLVDKEKEVQQTKQSLRVSEVLVIVTIAFTVICFVILMMYMNMKHRQKVRERSEMLAIISENEMSNRKLQSDVAELLRKNFSVINTLCYEYFEKADTIYLKKSIYREVENEIMKLKAPEHIKELEDALNKYCNNIMDKVSEQLPLLNENERTLLVYLYSGLSARTICILTEIQIKNFYMRRQRLKNKILSSKAKDKDLFVSMM